MVKLIVIARVISEDVYLRSIEQGILITPALEKKFRVPVRDPETWYIGRLAIEIKNSYERLYKRPLGQIKYLKDNEDDCDLDPELSVTDLLVDEGKAARDGSDQRVTVKIIQEQGRDVRAGSVIPDLTPAHYQPPARPPVPKFSDNKRAHENQHAGPPPAKRRRLGQIEEEEGEDVIDSIERDGERAVSHFELSDARFLSALNGETYAGALQPKAESPELAMPWTNTQPPTRDELELLPEAPTNLHFRSPRTGLPTSAPRRSRNIEIRESSQIPPEDAERNPTPGANKSRHPVADRLQRHHSSSKAPITPPYTANAFETPADQAVSMLNGMKSASPAQRQSNSSSANKFRKPGTNGKDVYDYPESDIDDTQMSPRSRALRTNITPKQITPRLVQTPHSRNGSETAASAARRNSIATTSANGTDHSRSRDRDHPRRSYVTGESPARQPEENGVDAMDIDMNKENEDVVSIDIVESTIPVEPPTEDRQSMMNIEKNPVLGSDERYIQGADGTRSKVKKPGSASMRGTSTDKNPRSRSHSVVSSAKESHRSGHSDKSHRSERREHGKTADASPHQADTTDELDGPGEQLLQALQQSSPAFKKTEVRVDIPVRKLHLQRQSAMSKMQPHEGGEEDDVERPPESVSEENDTIPKPKATKRAKSTPRSSGKQSEDDRKCLTCWRKRSKCDNLRPKCTSCEKYKKNCQMFELTKGAADEIFDQRRADKRKDTRSKSKVRASEELAEDDHDKTASAAPPVPQLRKPKPKVRKSTAAPSEDVVSASSGDERDPNEHEPNMEKSGAKANERKPKASKSERLVPVSEERETATQEPKAEKPTSIPEKKTKKSKTALSDELVTTSYQEDASRRAKKSRRDKYASTEESVVEGSATSELKKQNLSVPADTKSDQEASAERRATSSGRIIPSNMTEEEYNLIVIRRAGLTEEQRRAENLRFQKLDKQKESTPLPRSQIVDQNPKSDKHNRNAKETPPQVPRSSSSQAASDRTKEQPSKAKEDVKAPSSTQGSVKDRGRKSLPATQPMPITALPANSTPVPAKEATQPATEPAKSRSTAQKRVKPIPIKTSENNNVKNNPLFRPPKPQPVSTTTLGFASVNQPASTSTASKTAPVISISQVKSLSNLRDLINKNKSASSTPQPASAAARLVAEAKKKKGFSLDVDEDDDDDEDEDEESESDEDEEDDTKGVGGTGVGKGLVIVRPRALTAELESGSELSDDEL